MVKSPFFHAWIIIFDGEFCKFPSFDGLNLSYVGQPPAALLVCPLALASDDNATSFISCCVLGMSVETWDTFLVLDLSM